MVLYIQYTKLKVEQHEDDLYNDLEAHGDPQRYARVRLQVNMRRVTHWIRLEAPSCKLVQIDWICSLQGSHPT